MAIISSHLLNSTNGRHASGVKVLINQIKNNGDRLKLVETLTDKNGRIYKEIKLSKKNINKNYEIIFNIGKYFSKKSNVSEIIIKFKSLNQSKLDASGMGLSTVSSWRYSNTQSQGAFVKKILTRYLEWVN